MDHVWCGDWAVSKTPEDQEWMHQDPYDELELGDRAAELIFLEDVEKRER